MPVRASLACPCRNTPWVRIIGTAKPLRTCECLAFDCGPLETLTVAIDPDALGITLQNIIDNALSHGAAGTTVEVATVHVINDLLSGQGVFIAAKYLSKGAFGVIKVASKAEIAVTTFGMVIGSFWSGYAAAKSFE